MALSVRPNIDPGLCIADTGCRECILACPHNLLVLVGGKVRVLEREPCEPFWACFHVCPMAAITMAPEYGTKTP